MFSTATSVSNQNLDLLSQDLFERVLTKLGFSDTPNADFESLKKIYHSWCRKVPFDNTLWLIYLSNGGFGNLPGAEPSEFFQNWLRFGTGGMCFPAVGAMHALLTQIGFNVSPLLAWMPDNEHAMLIAECEDMPYLIDQSVPHSEPIPFDPSHPETVSPGWGMRVYNERGRWNFRWKTFRGGLEDIGCLVDPKHYAQRIDRAATVLGDCQQRYFECKNWSRYNYNLNGTIYRNDFMTRVVEGKKEVIIDQGGGVVQSPITPEERTALLINVFGISEEIASKVPADRPTVPLSQVLNMAVPNMSVPNMGAPNMSAPNMSAPIISVA